MNEKLRKRLEKSPIPAVYGKSGWRVLTYPNGVHRCDIDRAVARGEACFHFRGLVLTNGSEKEVKA